MQNLERERSHIPEGSNIFYVDPATLIRDNPAALIVNRASYERMEAHFSPEQMDPPQVVWVRTYSLEHGQIRRLFVVDGLTRTMFASDHKDLALSDYPGFSFASIPVRDVTASYLRNPVIVPFDERNDDRSDLTIIQFLRAVIPPTVEHSEIAPDRIAAHLINGWENMVGEELSSQFSALAALSFLDNPLVPIATDNSLKRHLDGLKQLVSGETVETRSRLQQGLLEMAWIIRTSKLNRNEVAESAYVLISAGSPVIGGERQSYRQIYGLLHNPEIERKLQEAYPHVGDLEEMRRQLGNQTHQAFQKYSNQPNGQSTLRDLQDALKDPSLTFEHVLDIYTTESPSERYNQLRQEVNKSKLINFYLAAGRKQKISDFEMTLLGNLGGKTYLADDQLPALFRAANSAHEMALRASTYREALNLQKTQYQTEGVDPKYVEESILKIGRLINGFIPASTAQELTKMVHELEKGISEIDRGVNVQRKTHRFGLLVDQAFDVAVQSEWGSQIRLGIVAYLMSDAHIMTEEDVNKRLLQLKGLSDDLRARIMAQEITLARAYQLQEDTKNAGTRPASSGSPLAIETGLEPAMIVDIAQVENTQIVADIAREEQTRVEDNRLHLNQMLGAITRYRSALSDIHLKSTELTSEQKTELSFWLQTLGKLRFGVDILRRIEDYPFLEAERDNLKRQLIIQNFENDQRDARTGR